MFILIIIAIITVVFLSCSFIFSQCYITTYYYLNNVAVNPYIHNLIHHLTGGTALCFSHVVTSSPRATSSTTLLWYKWLRLFTSGSFALAVGVRGQLLSTRSHHCCRWPSSTSSHIVWIEGVGLGICDAAEVALSTCRASSKRWLVPRMLLCLVVEVASRWMVESAAAHLIRLWELWALEIALISLARAAPVLWVVLTSH